MNNQTEFVLSQDLAAGFTVLNNNILSCGLSFNALGLYATIIQKAYIPGWKVYQSTLTTTINKKSAVSNGIKELIEFGLITKEQIRNEKGHIKGVKYTINATPKRKKDYSTNEFLDNAQPIENTSVEPKAKKQISVKPTSVKQPLINKDNNKTKIKVNKDTTTRDNNKIIENNTKNSSSQEQNENKIELENNSRLEKSNSTDIDLNIKAITKCNIKKLELNQEQIELLEEYVKLSKYEDIDKFSYYIAKSIKQGQITVKDLVNITSSTSNKQSEQKIQNFREKDYDYDALTRELLGWDD